VDVPLWQLESLLNEKLKSLNPYCSGCTALAADSIDDCTSDFYDRFLLIFSSFYLSKTI
jgi:hypothetical protein